MDFALISESFLCRFLLISHLFQCRFSVFYRFRTYFNVVSVYFLRTLTKKDGFLGVGSWVWVPEYGFLGMGSWVYPHPHPHMGSLAWVPNHWEMSSVWLHFLYFSFQLWISHLGVHPHPHPHIGSWAWVPNHLEILSSKSRWAILGCTHAHTHSSWAWV